MPLLIAGEPAEGVAARDMAAPIAASLAWSDMGGSDHQRAIARPATRDQSTDPRRNPAPLADGGTSPTGIIPGVALAAGDERSNAADQPGKAQVSSEPAASPEPDATPGTEPEAKNPTPEPTAGPTPSSPPAGETGEDEPSEGKVTLCHKSKTHSVGEDAVAEHLAHGDTIGACP